MWNRKFNNDAVSTNPKSNFEIGFKWIEKNNIGSWITVCTEEDIPRMLRTGRDNFTDVHLAANPGKFCKWIDHGRMYKQRNTGKCFLVVHIYDGGHPFEEMVEWCRKNYLTLTILPQSWYGFSTTTYVITVTE